MKRGTHLFLLYLVLSLSFSSNFVFSQANNPVLREQSILSQCSVNAKSGSDTIKVVLKMTQPNKVMISLYPKGSEGDIYQTQIIPITEVPNDNIYRFTYQNKQYATDPKNLAEIVYSDGEKICSIDETDKSGQRASTQEETSACGNLVRGPVSLPVDLVGDGRMATAACEYSINWGEQPFGQYLPFSGSCVSFIPCPEEDPEEEPEILPEEPQIEEPEKCSDINDPTECDSHSSLNCEWTGERSSGNVPWECTLDPLLRIILTPFIIFFRIIANIFFSIFDPSAVQPLINDCSQNQAWSGGSSTDIPGHCVDKKCGDTDRNANYPDGKNYYYPGKLGDQADNCISRTSLKEIYCDTDGKPGVGSYACSSEGKICAGPVDEGACYDIDPEDISRFRKAVEEYQQVIEEIERLANLYPRQGSQHGEDVMDIGNEIRKAHIASKLRYNIRSYFQEYYNKKPSPTLKLEIAKVNALLATYEFNMQVVAEIIDENQIKRDYIAAHNGFTEVYSDIIRSNNLDTGQKILISEALTSRAALDLQAGEILLSANVDIRDYRPRFEQILSSLASARKYDPSNGRAREIQRSLRISILNTIDKRINEELRFMTEHPLKLYGIPTLSSEEIKSLNGFTTSISQGFLNTLNVFRAYANIEEIDEKVGVAAEKGVLQRTAITYLKTIEELGGDISKFNSLTTRTQRKEYLQSIFRRADKEDVDKIYNVISLVLYGVQGNGNPTEQDVINPDLILLSQDGVLTEPYRNFYSPDFMFLENKGYIIPEELGGKWYDALLQEVNAVNIGLVLLPAATISKGITISQYASKLIGITKIGDGIIAVQRAEMSIGGLNLNPTVTLPGGIGKIIQGTLQSVVTGTQKVELIAAQMGTGVGTYLTVAEVNPTVAFALSGALDVSSPIIDLPADKATLLINRIIEGAPREISEALVGAGFRKEVADILATRVSKAFVLEQKESVIGLLKKLVNEEKGSLNLGPWNKEINNDAEDILKEKINLRLKTLAKEEYVKIKVGDIDVRPPKDIIPSEVRITKTITQELEDIIIKEPTENLFVIEKIDFTELGQIIGSNKINLDNIQALFSHEYMPGVNGAKGLAYIDGFGQTHVRFWKTGEGRIGNNVHHRDVLAGLLHEEAQGLERIAFKLNDLTYLEKAIELDDIATKLSSVRLQSSFPDEILERSEGFQLSLNEQGKIGFLDIDSSITTSQVSRNIKIDANQLSSMIKALHESISPELRWYRSVRIENLGKLDINGELQLPEGLPAIELLR